MPRDDLETIKFALEECRIAFETHARAGRVALAEKYWKRAVGLSAMLEEAIAETSDA